MKKFNVTGNCIPDENYMVDINDKLEQIKRLIDDKCYFTINRGRQYGKTTTLQELEKILASEYIVASISFQGIGDESFDSAENFCTTFVKHISKALKFSSADKEYTKKWNNASVVNFDLLSEHITELCENKKLVLMIDEVDRTSNNRIFLQFIGMLREKFLARRNKKDYTFHSIILAGVYDIKNIKLKLKDEGLYIPSETENKLYNSPWNIAVNFKVDMSFNPAEIATMLKEYEKEHNTGMDISKMSEEIYSYTSGYPFLVSRICQHIDEDCNENWKKDGVQEAVKMLLEEANTLFDDLRKNIASYPDLKKFLYDLLFLGEAKTFNIDNPVINLGFMFGYFKNDNGTTKLSNKIFELRIYNYFISENETSGEIKIKQPPKSEIIENGRLNMELCLLKFAHHYAEVYRLKDSKFLEYHGGLLFMTYLKPIINGHGFCYIESQTNDFKIDIAVNYGNDQFIIELKIWHGQKLHQEAYEQLANYLNLKNADTGFLLTFDFRKEANKERRAEWVEIDDKKIFDVIV